MREPKLFAKILSSFLLLACSFASAQVSSVHSIAQSLGNQTKTHPLVLLGEMHRNGQEHALLQKLLKEPDFICKFDDIVVEFGNARLQPLADRYIFGESVSGSDTRSIWQDTGQWLTWDSPVYQQFFATVRDDNLHHLCNHQVRVLLGDPPVDWSLIKSAADYKPFADRDGFFASVVEREVLAKGRHALLIAGVLHDLKATPADGSAGSSGLAEIIERKHSGALFVVLPVNDAEIAKQLRLPSAPSLSVLQGSKLAEVSYGVLVPKGIRRRVKENGALVWKPMGELAWPPAGKVLDALLYVGDDSAQVPASAELYQDAKYQAELRERAKVLKEVYDLDFLPELEDEIKRGSSPR